MSIFAPVAYTGRTKQSIIEMAFEELSLSGFEFDITPEEVAKALRRLNVMMSETPFSLMGYNQPLEEEGSAAEASGLADADIPGIVFYLARRMARMIGKQLVLDADANRAMYALMGKYTPCRDVDYANATLRGAGGAKGSVYFPAAFDEEAIATDNDPGDLAGLTGA